MKIYYWDDIKLNLNEIENNFLVEDLKENKNHIIKDIEDEIIRANHHLKDIYIFYRSFYLFKAVYILTIGFSNGGDFNSSSKFLFAYFGEHGKFLATKELQERMK